MSRFPRPIEDYWRKAFDGRGVDTRGGFTLSVVPTLDRRRPAMILEGADGAIRAGLTPELAAATGVDGAKGMTIATLRKRLAGAGIALHDPDVLFYRSVEATPGIDAPGIDAPGIDAHGAVRRLGRADRAAFDAFQASASEQDREDAFVELDHWAVFGCFDGARLVAAASAILWDDGPVADLGVLTLPDARGRGHGRAVVRSISGFIRRQGHEPQYRCQCDNHASLALAKACGLTQFGTWEAGNAAPDPSGEQATASLR